MTDDNATAARDAAIETLRTGVAYLASSAIDSLALAGFTYERAREVVAQTLRAKADATAPTFEPRWPI